MKNKFIKTLVSGVLCLSMLLGVTACGDKGDPNTIRYGVWGSADELALYNEIISGFESLYAEEGYKVKLVPYSGEYYDTIKLEIAGRVAIIILAMPVINTLLNVILSVIK